MCGVALSSWLWGREAEEYQFAPVANAQMEKFSKMPTYLGTMGQVRSYALTLRVFSYSYKRISMSPAGQLEYRGNNHDNDLGWQMVF